MGRKTGAEKLITRNKTINYAANKFPRIGRDR